MSERQMTATDLIERLNRLDEQERIEAKRASEVGKSVLETVCALANEPGLGGGWIVLGVVREDQALFPSYEVEGIAPPDKTLADLASQCRASFNVPLRVGLSTEAVGGRPVELVFVPEVQPQDKPVFFKSQGRPRGAFRRIGSTDQRCTEDDLAVFYPGRQQAIFDAGTVADATLQDLSPDAIADYRQRRTEANPDAEELRWSDADLLLSLGCTQANATAALQPTVADVILFGTPQALRRCFPMARVDYIRVPGREWIPDPERRFDSVELRDPLFRLIRRALPAVLDDLPKRFGLEEGKAPRQDTPAMPLRVIREAIVNALMHRSYRSYRSHNPVQIIRYSNRLELRNPGFSLKSPEHLGEPGSTPRNRKIAAALHETRFAETKGSGIRVMREAMDEAGLSPPLFESDRSADRFVARHLFHHFLGPEDSAWLAQFRDAHLADDEARALVFVREAGAIDNAAYRALAKVDTLAASGTLQRLRDAGLLSQKGRGSATYYVPTDQLGSKPASGADGLSSKLSALSSNPPTKFDEARRRALLNELAGELAARVGAIGLRHPPEEVRELVLALAEARAWRVEELATLLRRNLQGVRQNYLRPLMREARRVMTRPEELNHPQQAYRAAGPSHEHH